MSNKFALSDTKRYTRNQSNFTVGFAGKMPSETEKSTSTPSDELNDARVDERDQEKRDGIALPSHVAGSGTLDRLVDTARDYARAAASDNTLKAYAKDWAHFTRWCRMKGAAPLPPSPEMIGLYLADLASGSGPSPALSVSTIDRRLSGLALEPTVGGTGALLAACDDPQGGAFGLFQAPNTG